jgi:hypothetical protein
MQCYVLQNSILTARPIRTSKESRPRRAGRSARPVRELGGCACIHNAGRSQMSAAFFNHLVDPDLAHGISAGTHPAEHVRPAVVPKTHGRAGTTRRVAGHDGLRRRMPLRSRSQARRLAVARPKGTRDRVGATDSRRDQATCFAVAGARKVEQKTYLRRSCSADSKWIALM